MLRNNMIPNPSPMYENKLVFNGETLHARDEDASNKMAIIFVAKMMYLIILLKVVFLFFTGIEQLPFFFLR